MKLLLRLPSIFPFESLSYGISSPSVPCYRFTQDRAVTVRKYLLGSRWRLGARSQDERPRSRDPLTRRIRTDGILRNARHLSFHVIVAFVSVVCSKCRCRHPAPLGNGLGELGETPPRRLHLDGVSRRNTNRASWNNEVSGSFSSSRRIK